MIVINWCNAYNISKGYIGCWCIAFVIITSGRFFKKKIGYMPEDDADSRAAVPKYEVRK